MSNLKATQAATLMLAISILLTACSASPSTDLTATQAPASLSTEVSITQVPELATTEVTVTQMPASPLTEVPVTQAPASCQLTQADMEGPFYVPGAPLRDRVGEGYVLQGVVRSGADCAPIPEAQIEFWMAGPDGEYADDYRATLIAGDDGAYRFESHFPPPYSGRPSHIHLRVSVQGFQTLVTQHYPVAGETSASLDLVIAPGN